MQMSAMKVHFQIAECNLSSAKIMQMSAMKVYFQIAECSLSYAKIMLSWDIYKNIVLILIKKASDSHEREA